MLLVSSYFLLIWPDKLSLTIYSPQNKSLRFNQIYGSALTKEEAFIILASDIPKPKVEICSLTCLLSCLAQELKKNPIICFSEHFIKVSPGMEEYFKKIVWTRLKIHLGCQQRLKKWFVLHSAVGQNSKVHFCFVNVGINLSLNQAKIIKTCF